jgi:hypothetical protein
MYDLHQIVDRYVAVWNEADPDARRSEVTELWTEEGVEFVEGAKFEGHKGLEFRVAEAHEAFVASGKYAVTRADDLAPHGDLATFTVRLQEAGTGGPVAWAARVFLLLTAEGRIREDYHLTVQPLIAD